MTRADAAANYLILKSELHGAIQTRDAVIDAIHARMQSVKAVTPTSVIDFDDTSFPHAITALINAQNKVRDLVGRMNQYASMADTREAPTIAMININVVGVISLS